MIAGKLAKWIVPALVLLVSAATACGSGGEGASINGDVPRFSTYQWETDFSKHNVPYYEIVPGGPGKDGIPSIDDPQFVGFDEADEYLVSREPVVAVEIQADARAYPLQILTWHEIVNDEVGGVPVVVTYCPLCSSAVVFERRIGDAVYDFGATGKLRFSDLIMYDRQTESWWQQIAGEAIVGELTGTGLEFVPAFVMSYSDFKAAYPDGSVLSRDTGYPDYVRLGRYGVNAYSDYDEIGSSPRMFAGHRDDRLPMMERVATVSIGDAHIAYPYPALRDVDVVNDEVGGEPIAVFFSPEALSALDARIIAESRQVGAATVLSRELEGRVLTFVRKGGEIVDEQTGTAWNVAGKATSGPLAGSQLQPLPHGNYFWFAWAAFQPDTEVWRP